MSKLTPLSLLFTAAAFAVTSAPLAAQVIRIDQPISSSLTPDGIYWDFNGGSIGTNSPGSITDQSGNGFHGVLQPAQTTAVNPTYAAGRFGTGVSITPSSANPAADRDPNIFWDASTPYTGQLDFVGKSFTGGAWLKLDSVTSPTSTQRIYIMERGYSGGSQNFFNFRLTRYSSQPNSIWAFHLELGNGTSANTTITSTMNEALAVGALPLGEWNHLGFTYQYGETESVVTFWLNGEQLGDSVLTNYKLAATSQAIHRTFRVGERSVSSYTSYWNGVIDDAFVTSGAYQFTAIPEPSAIFSTVAGGVIMFLRFRRRFC